MTAPLAFPTKTVHGIVLRADPRREACFTVVDTDAELYEWPDMSAISQRERLHRHMNNEMGALEIAAQTLVDFPDAPWELRMHLARQCWDESRHVAVLYRRLRELGGRKGEFPISNFEWSITSSLDTLAGRLAVQNRTFEAGEMDFLSKIPDKWREIGDEDTPRILEGILVDEIQHVRFANQWLKQLVQQDRRLLLKVALAARFLEAVIAAFLPKPGETNAAGTDMGRLQIKVPAVNVEDRRFAGFSDTEIGEMLRKSGFSSLLEVAESGG